MQYLNLPERALWPQLAQRPVKPAQDLARLVEEVFADIRQHGDQALLAYSRRFDRSERQALALSEAEIEQAEAALDPGLKAAIQLAAENIRCFHAAQIEAKSAEIETRPGVRCWREARPMERVGIYIPGGTAPLFSTILMLAIPAKLAGCGEIILCSPPNAQGELHPAILYTAKLVGVDRIFALGGIQAIGGLCFGTESLPKVDKIFGPGNQYVTAAKQAAQAYGLAIDMPAGPSEVLVIADHRANPDFVAADLLSQAEHGADSQVILLSDDEAILQASIAAVERQLAQLPRLDMAKEALSHSRAIRLPSLADCLAFSNLYAPEHLILALENPRAYTPLIAHAGSVFLGDYSCESAGDYASGTNHTLPTNGYARNYSGVSVDSFVKKITFQELSAEGIQAIGPAIELMAEAEALFAHKNAVSLRLQALKD